MAVTRSYTLPVARGSTWHKSFLDLFHREDLSDWFDVCDWMQAHGVKYESDITYDNYTFADYDAWVKFRMGWL